MKIAFFIIAAAAAALCFWLGAAEKTTESYSPSRFALFQGSVSASCVVNPGGFSQNVQQCMLKVDTRTGETWVLQLAVNGSGDPTVRSAVWAKVRNSGTFYPTGPPDND